jgi:hypothetical protein
MESSSISLFITITGRLRNELVDDDIDDDDDDDD